MCVNFEPANKEKIRAYFKVDADNFDYKKEAWPDYRAPIIRADDNGTPQVLLASFGLIPKNKMPPKVRFDTMNARAETVGELKTYKGPWINQQLCLIPMQAFYEPSYESGKAVRFRIEMADKTPLAIAGLWREWDDPEQPFSFTALTINADEHPVMKRFHKPDDEKRMMAIISPEDYEQWLTCRNHEIARVLMRASHDFQLEAQAAVKTPKAIPSTPSLF